MAFRPTPRDIRENWQNGNLVIVLPEKERIVPEEQKAEPEHRQTGRQRPDQIFAQTYSR